MAFIAVRCWRCDVVYGMSETMHEQRLKDGEGFFCPNGHSAAYKETEATKLRRERDRLQQRLAEKDDDINRLEASRRGLAGEITKLKKRAVNGVCPCCTRTFGNLARHMKTKHPDFKAEETNVVPLRSVS